MHAPDADETLRFRSEFDEKSGGDIDPVPADFPPSRGP
jgi:hypothetical protein